MLPYLKSSQLWTYIMYTKGKNDLCLLLNQGLNENGKKMVGKL